MSNKKLSIILVTFNADNYIYNCLRSITEQKTSDVEVIVIDGLSTDNTIEIINIFRSGIDIIISEEDRGIYDAMNKGIALSQGGWLYFIGADDYLLPGIIQVILKILKKRNTIYYGNVTGFGENKKYDGRFNKYKIMIKNICHQAIFYPRSVFDHYSFDLTYPISADQNLNILLFGDSRYRFKYINKNIANYGGEGLSTRIKDKAFIADKYKIFKRNIPLPIYYVYRIRLFFTSRLKNIKLQ